MNNHRLNLIATIRINIFIIYPSIYICRFQSIHHSDMLHCEKEMVILTLLRLSQLQLNDIMSSPTPHTEISYTLEIEGLWAKCRVSPIIHE